ncbi:MAG: glutaredoxin 3 [Mariprofundaceae bacterium]
MANIEIYSGDYCPYCMQAKALLKQRELDFTEYNVQSEPERRIEMVERAPGVRTIPQIFINNKHVGGFDQLSSLDRNGELENWLTNT